jgi:hypothetical protein
MSKRVRRWLMGVAMLAGPAARADGPAWDTADTHRGFVYRTYQSDGTNPCEGKGRVVKPAPPAPEVQPTALETRVEPAAPVAHPAFPRYSNGYQDPTYPVGPSHPGSAAPLTRPSAGYSFTPHLVRRSAAH